MSVFTTEEAVIEYGIQYLRIIGFSYPLYALANITIMMLRSVGTVNISIVVYSVSLVVNTFLNYVLIFGKLGAPALGVQGRRHRHGDRAGVRVRHRRRVHPL